jgi:hypothetical protein
MTADLAVNRFLGVLRHVERIEPGLVRAVCPLCYRQTLTVDTRQRVLAIRCENGCKRRWIEFVLREERDFPPPPVSANNTEPAVPLRLVESPPPPPPSSPSPPPPRADQAGGHRDDGYRPGEDDVLPRPGQKVFTFYSDIELDALPDPEYLVEGVFPMGGLGAVVARYNEGKTFLALDVALSIAANRPWHSRAVKYGVVVYVLGEGRGGLKKRVRAWKQHYRISGSVPIHFLTVPVSLISDDDPKALLKAIAGQLPAQPVLIVIDTLARAMPGGNENSSEDMGKAVASADLLREQTGATVMLVHHTGWEGERSRGHSSLPGAVDTEIRVKKDGTAITVSCGKQRDAEPFPEIGFQLHPVADTGSCVLIREAPVTPLGELRPKTLAGLRALKRLSRVGHVVPGKDWKENTGMAKSTFYEVRGQLLDHACVKNGEGEHADDWWVTPLGEALLHRLDRPPRDSETASESEG